MHFGKLIRSVALALPFVLAAGSAKATDVVDVVAGNDNLLTLAQALEASGLAATLRGRGPFTLFAPTDDAFAALPPGTLVNLMKPENKDELVRVLGYHVVPGMVKGYQISSKQKFLKTVEGSAVFAEGTAKGINFVSASPSRNRAGKANILSERWTGNGIVYVIDQVLLPN